jgi:hypothetical protein
MSLVDSGNSGDRARLVIKNLISNMRRNSESGHTGYAGPAQIMQSPSGHARQLIQPSFNSAKFLEGLGSEQRENIWPPLACAFEEGHRLVRQVDDVDLGVLSP